MHRLLVLLFVVAATTEVYGSSTSRGFQLPQRRKLYAADAAKEIEALIYKANTMTQQICKKFTDRPLQEAYGEKHYKLRVDLSHCNEDKIKVLGGQRTVSVLAKDCNYMALRLLPEIVDSNMAFWRSENGKVTIFLPYTTAGGSCGRAISSEVHEIPRLRPDTENPETDARFGLRRGMLKNLLNQEE